MAIESPATALSGPTEAETLPADPLAPKLDDERLDDLAEAPAPAFIETPRGERFEVAALGPVVARGLSQHLHSMSPVSATAGAEAVLKTERLLNQLGARTGKLPESGKAININFDYLTAPDHVNEVIDVVANELRDTMQLSRRGTRSHVDTAEAARELGLTQQQLLSRRAGEAWNAESLLAARYVLADSRDRLDQMAELIVAKQQGEKGADAQTRADFQHQLAVHAAIQAQIHGLAAEAGRALNQFRQIARGGLSGSQLEEALSLQARRGATPEDIAAFWLDAKMKGGTKAQDIYSRNAYRAGVLGMLREVYINSLLSALTTQAVNAGGNALNTLWLPVERLIAGSKAAVTGSDGVAAGEAAAMYYGMAMSLKDAWKFFAFTMRNEATAGSELGFDATNISLLGKGNGIAGDPSMGLGKLEGRGKAITSENAAASLTKGRNTLRRITGADPATLVNADQLQLAGPFAWGIDALGKVLRVPGRTLQSMDELFKTMNYRAEMHALAYRQAVNEGLSGREAFERMAQVVESPDAEMMKAADQFSHYATFTDELTSKSGEWLQSASGVPGMFLLAPFIRTPVNLLDYATQRALPIRPKVIKELMSEDPVVRDLAFAKVGTGAMVWGTAALLVAENYECGGDQKVCIMGGGPPPADKPQSDAFRRLGLQEYAIGWLGEDGKRTWYSFNRADPVGMMLGIAADVVQVMKASDPHTGDIMASVILASTSNNLISKTYLRGLSEAFEVITSKNDDTWRKYVARQASAFVPFSSAIRSAERTVDPAHRRVYSDLDIARVYVDTVRAQTPGLSTELPPWRNVWGEVQYANTALHVNWLSPIYTTFEKTGTAAQLDRDLMEMRVPLNMPPRTIYDGVRLGPWEYDRYTDLAGNGLKMPDGSIEALPVVRDGRTEGVVDVSGLGFHDALKKLAGTAWWKQATRSVDPPGQRVLAVNALKERYRSAARERLLGEFPELVEVARAAKRVSYRERTGADQDEAESVVVGEMAGLLSRVQQVMTYDASPRLKPGQGVEFR